MYNHVFHACKSPNQTSCHKGKCSVNLVIAGGHIVLPHGFVWVYVGKQYIWEGQLINLIVNFISKQLS